MGVTYYHPNVSGVSIYAKRLAEGLVKKGHQVTVMTSWHDRNTPRTEIKNGVVVRRSRVGLRVGKGAIMPLLPLELVGLISQCDAVNCHLPQFESFMFVLIGKLFGKKVYLTHHTDLSGWPGWFNRLSEGLVWAGQLTAALLADRLVPYTQDYADHSWFLRLFRRKTTCILPPIVSGDLDKPAQTKMRRLIGKTKYIIGFAGRIARQKGIPHLLNCIPLLEKEISEFKIVFAGPYKEVIGEGYYEEIGPLIKKYQSRLCFLGNISEEEMTSFYRLCHVLVLPSDDRLESFGLVQAEAMLAGCPVVATDLPGARMPVKMTQMGLITPVGDIKQLAESIARVVNHRKQFVRPVSIVKQVFNYQRTIDQYESLYLS